MIRMKRNFNVSRGVLVLLPAACFLALVSWFVHDAEASPKPEAKNPAAASGGTVVLELFTSQGCSSCPPADRLLTTLGTEQFASGTVIPLAWHVDYWNRLGWSDPFSSAQWSARQREYARVMRSSQVYTPQLILNGQTQLVGSSERAVRAEIARQLARKRLGFVSIRSLKPAASVLHVELEARADPSYTSGRMKLNVVLFENGVTTAVRRGENSGRALRNDHIVRWASEPLAFQTKSSIEIPLDSSWRPQNLGVAAFIQDSRTLEIFAAAVRNPEQ